MEKKIDLSEETIDVSEAEKKPGDDETVKASQDTEEAVVEEAEASEEETEDAQESEEDEKEAASENPFKAVFGKKDKKEKKDKKDEKIAELTDKLMRQMAEFENFRKRSEREKAQMFEIGAKDVVEKILPVLDNFERGFTTLQEEQKETPFVQGMDKVYKQMVSVFDSMGVTPIDSVGKEFDPKFHNAVMHIEDENLGENIVAEEFQKGYTYRDSVIRHSMVKVAN